MRPCGCKKTGEGSARIRRVAWRSIDEAVEDSSLKKLRYAEHVVSRLPPAERAEFRPELERAERLIRRSG